MGLRAVYIVPLVALPIFDATLWAAVWIHVAVRFPCVPVGVSERNARVRIRFPHKRRVAVVPDDSLSARVECWAGKATGAVIAGRGL